MRRRHDPAAAPQGSAAMGVAPVGMADLEAREPRRDIGDGGSSPDADGLRHATRRLAGGGADQHGVGVAEALLKRRSFSGVGATTTVGGSGAAGSGVGRRA